MSRRSRSSAVNIFIHGAASSRASGRASRRRQIAVTTGPFAGVRRNSGMDVPHPLHEQTHGGSAARSAGDVASTPAFSASGPTTYSRSPRKRRAARLVASTLSVPDRCQEIRHQRRRVQQLLEVVEHQQRRTIAARDARAARQVARADVRQSERFGNRRRDERRIANGGQRDEHHARRAFVRNRACEFQRQAGLPDASRTDERDQASRGIGEPAPQRLDIGIAAEQARERKRQRARRSVHRPPRVEPEFARFPGARRARRRSDPGPRTARARSRHAACAAPRARAR